MYSTCCYGAFTHVSVGGREVQNQNLQKCMKVVRERLAEVGDGPPWCPRSLVPLSACARGRQAVHARICNLQSKCAIQPASHARAGWLADRMHSAFRQPASRARASCIMHEDSGCTQIRSWMAGWMDGWMHASARARACIQPASRARASIMHAESGCTQIRSCTVCMPNLGGPYH